MISSMGTLTMPRSAFSSTVSFGFRFGVRMHGECVPCYAEEVVAEEEREEGDEKDESHVACCVEWRRGKSKS